MSDTVAEFETAVWELARIQPHPRNPRKHPEPGSPKWEALKKSLSYDYFDPMVVNLRNGMLVSGHLRLSVLMEMGTTHARVVVVDYDEATHLARLIAANKLLGEFEETLLGALARDIDTAGLDAGLAGFTDKELTALLDGPATVDDTADAAMLLSRAEELQELWRVQPGDVYQIGGHRLACGDCESQENWQRLLQGRVLDMIWTDPPYNVGINARNPRKPEGHATHAGAGTILNDKMSAASYAAILLRWFTAALINTKPGGTVYVSHAETNGTPTRNAFDLAGWRLSQCLVWVKSSATISRQDYQWQHEPILYGWRPGAAHYWQGGFRQRTVIDEEKDASKLSKAELLALVNELRNQRETTIIRESKSRDNSLHPTIKPLPLVARHIWNSSRRGETVGELFAGSGTTLAAAEQTGRHCVAHEEDPKFCAVTLERMKAYGLTIEKIHGPQ